MVIIFFLVSLTIQNGFLVKAQQPLFSEKFAYFFTVSEAVEIGYRFGYVNATMSDHTKSITYEIFNIANKSVAIDNATGALYLNTKLDADIPNLHEIKFSVSAYHDPNYKATTIVYLYIGDVNDNFPVFQGTPYKANVTEDSPINTYVTRIQATDIDKKGLSELIYSIEGWTKDSLFSIKPFAGTIWTHKRLDYEALKKEVLNVSVTDGRPSDSTRHTVFTQVELSIVDADDQGAKFDKYTYYASIEEGFHNLTDLLRVHAADLDKGINAAVTYSILQGTNPQGSYLIDKASGQIKVDGLIDREANGNIFYLTVQASSTTHSPASANIIISINDTNDNGPVFPKSFYVGSVLENALLGTKVIHVQAVDADDGINKAITYSIKGGSEKFRIDADGYVIVNGSLDRELKDNYTFEVHAVESFTKERYQNSTIVTISIQDVNDNSPVFSKRFLEVFVQEELPSGVSITQVNASDRDSGPNGLIEYSLVPDAESKYRAFYINPSNGQLNTAQKLDRESTAVYFLLVKAVDRAPAGQTRESLCTVKVSVVDINDNAPYFSATNYVTSVTEAANLNTIVFALTAFDKDEGENSKLQYYLFKSNQSQFFKIDTKSGVITTAKELDRETQSLFHLQVGVKDGGNMSSSVQVQVNVLDINDNAPVFSQIDGYKFNVTEEQAGAIVGYVKAHDIDEGDSGKVNYAITDSELFKIDKVSGKITTNAALDREKNSLYTITVVAKDLSKTGPRKSFSKVEISVSDINDNAPVFAASKQYSTVMHKDWENGTFVYRFQAIDNDANENGRIFFQIMDENKGFFTLDNKTGILRLKSQTPSQVNNSMSIHVAAFDNGKPQLNDTATLYIFFANVLKNAPIIQPLVIRASVTENQPSGVMVYDINATYEGKTNEEKFKYSITYGGEDRFKIHFETGEITTLAKLDREIRAKYTLVIMVQLRLRSEANFATVEINVVDQNDNPPVFQKELFVASIYENQKPNTTVTSVEATDKDANTNARITYQIYGSEHFYVDEYTGVIFTNIMLDREKADKYNLTIIATNAFSDVKLNASCKVLVNVLDLDDNPPLFDKSIYVGSIAENTPVNASVLQVRAQDIDEGVNAEIMYDVEGSDCFFIERQTGVIRNSCVLDRETTPSYQLKLIAKGKQNFSLSSTAKLNVVVTDIDDNHPHFTSSVYRFSPAEDLSLGSIIGTCNVNDRDLSTGRVFYQIHSGNNADYFDLNNETGVLKLKKNLDRETISMFSMKIRIYYWASLHASVGLKRRSLASQSQLDEATIMIFVQDVNDNAPIFTKTTFTAVVHKDAKFNHFVLQVYANDSDMGNHSSLVYHIISGNNENNFHIEKETGKIFVYKSLVSDIGKTVTLSVSANDNRGLLPTNQAINNAIAVIHIIGDDKVGILTVGSSANYLHKYLADLNRLLSNATRSTAKIFQIKPTSNKKSFLAYFYGFDETKKEVLTREQLSRSILWPKTTLLESSFEKWNITWYREFTPTSLKSVSIKESHKEIYIGIIAAMAILLIIVVLVATRSLWLTRKSRRNISGVDAPMRNEPMRIADDSYSVETIKSARSANHYIIEPYESNENLEAEEELPESEEEANLQSSPFYTVESHHDTTSGIEQTDYLSYNSIRTPTWAYGDDTSLNSLEQVDELVAQKLSSCSESLSQVNHSNISLDISEQPQNVPPFDISEQPFNADKPPLNTAGPLFTSERVDDFIAEESFLTNKSDEQNLLQASQTDDSNDQRKSPTEEECNVDENMTFESDCATLDCTLPSDATLDTFDASDAGANNLDASYASRDTVNRFYQNTDTDHSLHSSLQDLPTTTDQYSNSKKCEDNSSAGRCQSAPLKVLKVQKDTDDSDMVTYL